jgi:peptidoglycan L-alanyl-D-glutamate endopeptidase CwlK
MRERRLKMVMKQTDATKARLKTLDPDFEDLIIRLINHCHERGINVQVAQAYRSNEEQQALYDIGRTKPGKVVTNAKPGTSFHNYAAAADLFFINEKGEAYWDVKAFKKVWSVAQEIGLDKQGLVWGGDFKSLVDYPHFQLGSSLEEAKKRFEKRRGKTA